MNLIMRDLESSYGGGWNRCATVVERAHELLAFERAIRDIAFSCLRVLCILMFALRLDIHIFLSRRRRANWMEHFLQTMAPVSMGVDLRTMQLGHVRGSCERALWQQAHFLPVPGMRGAEDAQRCSNTCRDRCWTSTPSWSCPDGPFRRTWPGAARAPAECGVCRPVMAMVRIERGDVGEPAER
jgi:hypothetical protein